MIFSGKKSINFEARSRPATLGGTRSSHAIVRRKSIHFSGPAMPNLCPQCDGSVIACVR
jgi:hypothetical protein